MPFVELPLSTPTGGGLALPLLPTSALTQAQLQVMQAQLAQLAAAGRGGMPAAQHTAPTPSGSAGAAAVGGAQKGAKSKQKRLYKPPEQVQAEREEKVVVQERIRKLEQQLERAKKELEQLQQENKVLHRKAVVLSKHTSFRRSAAAMAAELTQSLTLSSMDWSQEHASRVALDAASRGLPPPRGAGPA
ncbi:Synaptonemal complex [Micractinium conductrix]|uniref:Synaptonemal complex n=1 Tax=Micractinium conductrix TaxID=554055 RepID=A0A2P6VK12_9CHLO|nr:Synaptonemal complex [Micractinium conductrix]|eukprot:PSC74390.1 Synaptonemal complex [Micractinium conductrix]